MPSTSCADIGSSTNNDRADRFPRVSHRRRHAAERRFRFYGIAAILFALGFLVFLFASIVSQGWSAFLQTSIQLPVYFNPAVINPSGNPKDEDELFGANFVKLAREALYKDLGVDAKNRKDRTDNFKQ